MIHISLLLLAFCSPIDEIGLNNKLKKGGKKKKSMHANACGPNKDNI